MVHWISDSEIILKPEKVVNAEFIPNTLGVTLPSGESAQDFVEGKSGSTWRLIWHYLGRSAIVGIGLAIVGVRGKKLLSYSLAGSAAIEAFVLGYAWLHKDEK